MTTSTQAAPQFTSDPSRGGASDWIAFDRALQTTEKHRAQHRLTPYIAQWEVLITLFKHSFEIPRLLEVGTDESQHRTALTGLLAMGETIWFQAKDLDDETLAKAGYKKEFVQSNLEYLRDKYNDWYTPKDATQIKADWDTIRDALAKAS